MTVFKTKKLNNKVALSSLKEGELFMYGRSVWMVWDDCCYNLNFDYCEELKSDTRVKLVKTFVAYV